MLLYHYTNKNIKNYLEVKYFNTNYFTNNDNNISNLKRLFFYTTKKAQEIIFKTSQYIYTAKINDKNIYNLDIDKLNFKNRYKSIDKILRIIKKDYIGVKYNLGYNIVILFKKVKIYKKEVI